MPDGTAETGPKGLHARVSPGGEKQGPQSCWIEPACDAPKDMATVPMPLHLDLAAHPSSQYDPLHRLTEMTRGSDGRQI